MPLIYFSAPLAPWILWSLDHVPRILESYGHAFSFPLSLSECNILSILSLIPDILSSS
jgi:hypothetical protein